MTRHRLKPAARRRLGRRADALLATGMDADGVIKSIVSTIDASIDFVSLGSALGPVGAGVGAVLEIVDGPVATAIATGVVRAAERRRARQAG